MASLRQGSSMPREGVKGILANIGRYVSINDHEAGALQSILRLRSVQKKELLIRPGEASDHQWYVVQGALRNYYLSPDGQEHTLQFAIEDWFISDFGSYVQREPATLFIEALEDSTLLQLSYSEIEVLCDTYPVFERFFRLVAQKAFAYSQKRVLSNLGLTAAERYESFRSLYPEIVQRVPQYALASYLGMTPEFLSRIRRQIARS